MIDEEDLDFDEDEDPGDNPAFGGEPPSTPVRHQANAIRESGDYLRYRHRLLLRLISRIVRWIDFWEYEDKKGKTRRLSFLRFEALVKLSMAELFAEYTDKDLAKILGILPGWLKSSREHPQFEPIKEAVAEAARKLRDSKGVDSLAELLEGDVAIEVGATALFAKSGREKQGAQDALLDRRSAKKGRGGEAPSIHLHLPEGFQATRDRALEIQAEILKDRQRYLPAPEDDVIDASFVRVPDDDLPEGGP